MHKLPASQCAGLQKLRGEKPLTISTLVISLRGSTQPKLVLCSNGRLYVLKMQANPAGSNALANEYIGAAILPGLGFKVPCARTVLIDQETLNDHPTLMLMGSNGREYRPAVGLHFASEYVEGFTLQNGRSESMQNPEFLGIGLFDIWAAHSDTRQFIRRFDLEKRRLECLFIDNSSLFGGPEWEATKLTAYSMKKALADVIPATTYERLIPSWIDLFQSRIPGLLREAVASTPPEWYRGDLRELELFLLRRLENIQLLVSTATSPGSYRLLLTLTARNCSYSDAISR